MHPDCAHFRGSYVRNYIYIERKKNSGDQDWREKKERKTQRQEHNYIKLIYWDKNERKRDRQKKKIDLAKVNDDK